MEKKKAEASIIEIIQKMVKEGESEEKIVKTLVDLGVDQKKAKKLLLIGEADTFALLRSDLVKIVRENLENEKPALEKSIQEEIDRNANEMKQELSLTALAEIKEYEKKLREQIEEFKKQEQEKTDKMSFLSDKTKEKINELGSITQTIQLDLDEMKVKGISGQNRNISRLLILLGVIFGATDLYFLFTLFNSSISVDSIIVMVLIALISITMFFVATVI